MWEDTEGWVSGDITLSESWKTFDELIVIGGNDDKTWFEPVTRDVASVLAMLDLSLTPVWMIWAGAFTSYWKVTSSDDGLILYDIIENSVLWSITGVRYN